MSKKIIKHCLVCKKDGHHWNDHYLFFRKVKPPTHTSEEIK